MSINIEIIKYDNRDSRSNDIIVYKHEKEDFGCHAQLLVSPSQVALFVNEGEIIPFLPGHYTLDESNNSAFSGINKLKNWFSKGESSFHCSVYFINLVTLNDLKFGTQTPIQMEDPVEGVNIHVRAAGLFGAHLDNDSADCKEVIKFFTKVNGNRGLFTKEDLETYLRGKMIERVADNLGKLMIDRKIGILSVSSHYAELSDLMKAQMAPYFQDYGIKIDNFSFMTINVPDDDIAAINEMKIKARQMDMESEAMARKRAREGYSYQQEKGFDVLKTAAANEAQPGQFMGAGMGLGMGLGMGGAMGGAMGNVANNTFASMNEAPKNNEEKDKCPNCGAEINKGAKFCPNCGHKLGLTCPNCGESVSLNSKFCPNCGQPLNVSKKCASCGAELKPGAKFCPDCGAKVE